MTENSDLIAQLLELYKDMDNLTVASSDIPDIDLYMDQVTTFMDRSLSAAKLHEDDKLMTKTMINNYAKNGLLPPPVKKKYSRGHMILLTLICYFKGFLSISDIQVLLAPLTETYFDDPDRLCNVYDQLLGLCKDQIADLTDDVEELAGSTAGAFADYPPEEVEYLQRLTLICSLGLDVFVKKQMIERMIDDMRGGDRPIKSPKADDQ